MKAIVKVEKAGILIPKERLKGINEGDIVEIQIKKLYMTKRTKKAFNSYLQFFTFLYKK